MMNGKDYGDCCPDCDEPLLIRRGIVALTATRYCQSCNWCEVADRGRQENAKMDWYVRNIMNREEDIWDE